jgi:hypothetical protein
MISPVAVRSNTLKPLNSTLALGLYFRVLTEGRAKWLFSLSSHKSTRGHHPPLENVDATDSDKRDELALCLLGEHPSGQRQVGFDKVLVAPLLNSLDKREHLSPVDNTVDNLPTGTPSGGPSTSNVLNLQRGYGNHE